MITLRKEMLDRVRVFMNSRPALQNFNVTEHIELRDQPGMLRYTIHPVSYEGIAGFIVNGNGHHPSFPVAIGRIAQ